MTPWKKVFAATTALAALAGARMARGAANALDTTSTVQIPYAPTPSQAPFVTLGYRELGADVLYVRMVGYFAGIAGDADTIATLAESITTLDPTFRRAYELGAIATTSAAHGVNNETRFRAIALLRRAAFVFPRSAHYPTLAAQIYLTDLETRDPVQRRAWDEQAALLLESAARKPGARADAGLTAAFLQTRAGQRERAIGNLRELLLVTSDTDARKELIERLSKLSNQDSEVIAAEMLEARHRIETAWRNQRPAVPITMYFLVGSPLSPGFNLDELATGDRDLIGTDGFERLESLTDSTSTP